MVVVKMDFVKRRIQKYTGKYLDKVLPQDATTDTSVNSIIKTTRKINKSTRRVKSAYRNSKRTTK